MIPTVEICMKSSLINCVWVLNRLNISISSITNVNTFYTSIHISADTNTCTRTRGVHTIAFTHVNTYAHVAAIQMNIKQIFSAISCVSVKWRRGCRFIISKQFFAKVVAGDVDDAGCFACLPLPPPKLMHAITEVVLFAYQSLWFHIWNRVGNKVFFFRFLSFLRLRFCFLFFFCLLSASHTLWEIIEFVIIYVLKC